MSLFDDGVRILEERTGVALLRRVSLRGRTSRSTPRTAWRCRPRPATRRPPARGIAIVRLPCISNATDFRLLTWADWIDVAAGTATTTSSSCPAARTPSPICLAASDRARRLGRRRSIAAARRSSASAAAFRCSVATIRDPAGGRIARAASAGGLGLLPAETVLARGEDDRASVRRRPRGGVTFGGLRDSPRRHDRRSQADRAVRAPRRWLAPTAPAVLRSRSAPTCTAPSRTRTVCAEVSACERRRRRRRASTTNGSATGSTQHAPAAGRSSASLMRGRCHDLGGHASQGTSEHVRPAAPRPVSGRRLEGAASGAEHVGPATAARSTTFASC